MPHSWLSPLLAACLVLLAPAVPAQTTELEGAKFEHELQLGGSRLQLNGAGVRYKAIFKVYAAGLYLDARTQAPEAVLSTAAPRRLSIVLLRDIDANELGKLFTRGMEQNATREEFSKSIAGIARLGEVFAAKKRLAAGESFQVDWLPGQGTVILINGKPAAEPIREPEFYSALMKIWLGKEPADAQLKKALLGQAGRG
ncbi:chalcone isomerase family protein [Caldimonas tepidiphila]|uniref:chalcone isomerase family protein n=1 Tax=Caldimonas tepidiphila TaxID=2315841 RepID=UPI0014735CCF|nr:chalcone isomerase family protein [Caldimonas tepidiphila]